MGLFSRRNSSLDRRLSMLDRELEQVSHTLKRAKKKRAPNPRKLPVPPAGRWASDKKKPEDESRVREVVRVKKNGNDTPIAGEKFANYFTAGHFQNLRPLRQERRIVRNKAIVMVVVVIVVLLWVLYFII